MHKKRAKSRIWLPTEAKKEKFSFEKMKVAATHASPSIRRQAFIDYFEQFGEFPSYLFDNSSNIDPRLLETIQGLQKDPETTRAMYKGITALMLRLPS